MFSSLALAESDNSDKLLDALTAEASETSMKEVTSDRSNEQEPEVEVTDTTNVDDLSESVAKKLSGILGGNAVEDEKETEAKLEGLVTSALLDGVKMDDLRSAVSEAMQDIAETEEDTDKVKKASQSLDKLIGSGASTEKEPEGSYVKAQQKEAEESSSSVKSASTGELGGNKVDNSALPDTVVVQKGDSLYRIALRVYGSGNHYVRLYEANKDIISNPNIVVVGQKLKVPK